MDGNETDGVSSSVKRLFDWVRNPSKNGKVYQSDVPTYTIREVLFLLSDEDGIFEAEEGEEWGSSHLSVRPGIQNSDSNCNVPTPPWGHRPIRGW